MLTALWRAARAAAAHVPGVVWVGLFVAVYLGVSVFGLGASIADARLERRVAAADSIARQRTLEAVVLRRDARALAARADSAEVRARQDSTDAAAARRELEQLRAKAAASSARVDRSTLPAAALEALNDADAFRLAITPALARDSVEASAWRTEAELRVHAYEQLAEAYAAQGAALLARESEIRALEQRRAPRCGWKCGAGIGATLTAFAIAALHAL